VCWAHGWAVQNGWIDRGSKESYSLLDGVHIGQGVTKRRCSPLSHYFGHLWRMSFGLHPNCALLTDYFCCYLKWKKVFVRLQVIFSCRFSLHRAHSLTRFKQICCIIRGANKNVIWLLVFYTWHLIRRQTPASLTSLPPYTICRRASNNNWAAESLIFPICKVGLLRAYFVV